MFRLNLWQNPKRPEPSEQTSNQDPFSGTRDIPNQKCLYCRFGHHGVVAMNVGIGILTLIAGVAGLISCFTDQDNTIHNVSAQLTTSSKLII